jgi:hypothetical protein
MLKKGLKSNKDIEDDHEDLLMRGSSVLQFSEEDHKDIYEHLQELPQHRKCLSRFGIMYKKCNEKEMDHYITRELQQNKKLPGIEVDLAYIYFRESMKD